MRFRPIAFFNKLHSLIQLTSGGDEAALGGSGSGSSGSFAGPADAVAAAAAADG